MATLRDYLLSNGTDWWVAITKGYASIELKHKTDLSSILECGHSLSKYGYVELHQCGYDKDTYNDDNYFNDLVITD